MPEPTCRTLPILCDQRGPGRCCGTPACETAGIWNSDPYLGPAVLIQGHMHSEPACAWWDCTTTLSRSAMATMQATAEAGDEPPEPTCRTCHRPIDTDHEPIEAGRCPDCATDVARETAGGGQS